MRVTPISRCLDRRLVLFGFDVGDLLCVFFTLSCLYLVFGQTQMKILCVWLPTVSLACILRYGKKGKPEKYIIHWVRFQIMPGVFEAFEGCTAREFKQLLKENK